MGLSSKQVSSDMNSWNNQDLLESATTTTTTTLELPKTPPKIQLNCPRCDSTNTKFCYYNNYNKSQPRHFCKACKRHWTKGGTLRNVPVGGGRKNKRFKPSKPASKTTTNLTLLQPQESTLGGGSSFQDKTFCETFYQTFLKQQQQQQQQQHTSLPQSSITFTSNNNEGFYLDSTIKTTSLGLSSQQHDEIVEFPNYSNLESTITSIQTPNNNHLYNFTSDHPHPHPHHPWNMHASSSSSTRNNENNNNEVMDMMSSSWGWDDFDKFVSVEPDLTIPWDDDVDNIKP